MKYTFLAPSQLLISIVALISKDFLSKNKTISKAGGEGGEKIMKNGIAGTGAIMISGTWRNNFYCFFG